MRALGATLLIAALLCAPAARADHGPRYRGDYANAFLTGRSADGRPVAVMAGYHTDFPYHDPGSNYDQLAVLVGGVEPTVLTVRPKLAGFKLELGEQRVRLSYSGARPRAPARLAFDLELASVRHTSRYEGDPAQLGDFFLEHGFGSDESPGFVYTPYELMRLVRGRLVFRGSTIRLASLHGQAEAGRIEAPTDPGFRSAYDYLAAPTLESPAPGPVASRPPYTYLGFLTHALHSGSDGALDSYFRDTGSDEFTMERGELSDGNTHGAPEPFDNRGALPRGAGKLAQWSADLGPGILYRKLVRLRDRAGRALLVLSETIKEDGPAEQDSTRPAISRARVSGASVSFRLSEDALVNVRFAGRGWRLDRRAGANSFRVRARQTGRELTLRATDQRGNRSRLARLRVPARGSGSVRR
jgi:hypothetical protein